MSDERYAALTGGGWAYAVELVTGGAARRQHDLRPLAVVVQAWLDALAAPGGGVVSFAGASDGGETASFAAGTWLATVVVGIRHWTPRDDQAEDQAHQAAAALLSTLAYQAQPDGELADEQEPAGVSLG